ncbi:MAG TPA: hypothetical protein DEA52_02630 [Clostridiaceae bacterium]|nr:hypothetical protein [Clostridiaceae bacterium]
MTYIIAEKFPHPIIESTDAPLVSIYLPTSRLTNETKDNEIRFKNLLKKVEEELGKSYPGKKGEEILTDLKTLLEDKPFWHYQLDGLGILARAGEMVVYKLQRSVQEYVEVSHNFYVKPLINAYQSDDSYQVLSLNKNDFTLYEGNRYAIREVEIPKEEKKTLKDVVGKFFEETHLQTVSMGAGGKTMHGIGGSTRDEEAVDIEKYFRWVDRYIMDNHSKRTDLPLILASLPENHKDFEKLSHNEFLLKEGIKKDPQSLTLEELRLEAWEILKPAYLQNLKTLHEKYELNKSRELASEDLSEIARAALNSRVDTLMVNLEETVPGTIRIDRDRLLQEGPHGDMLNDVALLALKQKAKVYVVSKEELPLETGVKSIFRYPVT